MVKAESPINHSFLKKLRWISLVEGVSTLVLFFVAMPLKYMADMPGAVRIAGSIHGGLFILLLLMLTFAISKVPITPVMSLVGMLAAVIPFGPFIYDRWLVASADSES